MTHRSDFPYHELSVEERLLLVEDIWGSIAALPLTNEKAAEPKGRLAEHRAHAERAVGWEEAKAYASIQRSRRATMLSA